MTQLSIPDIADDVDTLTAALAYAGAGWYVAPAKRGTKDPGSILDKGWPRKTSRDADQIAAWFAGTDHDIALHCGRSGAIVFDVDAPDKTHPAALLGTPDDGVVAEWLGMKVILDVNVPTTSGSGNQDYVILGHSPDWLLYEGPLNFQAFKETSAAQMSVEVIGFKYAAFIPRYASSICLVGPFDNPGTTQGS
jgi:Bifunctional DNA primase/polymerase, N-terminal